MIVCALCGKALRNGHLPRLSPLNGLYFGDVPDTLQHLTREEVRLISLTIAIDTVYDLPGDRQKATNGNIINFHQDVGDFARRLPRRVSEAGLYYAVRPGESVDQKISVRPNPLRRALEWLCDHNVLYKNITRMSCRKCLAQLPVPTVGISDDNVRPEVPLQTFVFEERAGDNSAAHLDATVHALLSETETIIAGPARGTPVDERREVLFAKMMPESRCALTMKRESEAKCESHEVDSSWRFRAHRDLGLSP